MTQKFQSKNIAGLARVAVGFVLLVVFGLAINSLFASRASQFTDQHQPEYQSPGSSPTETVRQNDSTIGWKIVSSENANVRFTYKRPSEWDISPDYYCSKPVNFSESFDIPANCIKTVIFTDMIDRFSNDDGQGLIVTSETQLKVSGYKAIRQIYSYPKDDAPNTYELWIYDDSNKPIFLYLAYIGVGTDSKTAKSFVEIFDKVISTLDLHKR